MTDGGGLSLESLAGAIAPFAAWSSKDGWLPSVHVDGSPGRAPTIIGDSTFDGVFDSSDLVAIFQAGEFEDAVPHNSTFLEGDWNGDGDFTTSDLVFALATGLFVAS